MTPWQTSPPKLIDGFRETESIYVAKLAKTWDNYRSGRSIWHASRLAETFCVNWDSLVIDETPHEEAFSRLKEELEVRG